MRVVNDPLASVLKLKGLHLSSLSEELQHGFLHIIFPILHNREGIINNYIYLSIYKYFINSFY